MWGEVVALVGASDSTSARSDRPVGCIEHAGSKTLRRRLVHGHASCSNIAGQSEGNFGPCPGTRPLGRWGALALRAAPCGSVRDASGAVGPALMTRKCRVFPDLAAAAGIPGAPCCRRLRESPAVAGQPGTKQLGAGPGAAPQAASLPCAEVDSSGRSCVAWSPAMEPSAANTRPGAFRSPRRCYRFVPHPLPKAASIHSVGYCIR